MSKTIFIRHTSGATHALSGKRLAKLMSELKAGRGGAEIAKLQENGYTETLGGLDISVWSFETLAREASGRFDDV